jgi:hypothetical protein
MDCLVPRAPVGGDVKLKTIFGWFAVAFVVATAAAGISHFFQSLS